MEFIIDGRFRIRTCSGWPSFEIHEAKGEPPNMEWVHTNEYPITVSKALRTILEIESEREEGITEGLEAAIECAEDIEERIMKGILENG